MLLDRLSNVQSVLQANGFTLANYVLEVLTNPEYAKEQRDSVIQNARPICAALCSIEVASVFPWVWQVAEDKLAEEILELSQVRNGLHFNASRCTSQFLEGSFMKETAQKIYTKGPFIHRLIRRLLDANPLRRRVATLPDSKVMPHKILEEFEGDLGDLEGTSPIQHDDSNSRSRKEKRSCARNMALMDIKTVVVISILMQSTNESCNYLQAIFGIFLHSANTPEKVVEALAHSGLSVALSSIHRMIRSLSKEAETKIRETMQTLTTSIAYDNFDINFKTSEPTAEKKSVFVSATSATAIPLFNVDNPSVLRCSTELWETDARNPFPSGRVVKIDVDNLDDLHQRYDQYFQDVVRSSEEGDESRPSPFLDNCAWHIRSILINRLPAFKHFSPMLGEPAVLRKIPLHRTTQIPCRSMNIKESTTDGNIEVVETLLRCGGLGELDDTTFTPGKDIDMSEYVILVHGDLLTKERLESAQLSRRIETSAKRRLQGIKVVPGLFHLKMACVNAYWRAWIETKDSRVDRNSIFYHISILRSGETKKYESNPSFRQMHDAIHHDLQAAMLDCWQIEACLKEPVWSTLEAFAESKPSWETMVSMSTAIAQKYIAMPEVLGVLREEPCDDRDEIFENQTLRNRDGFLYLDLSYAMNTGDIGRVEALILPWIYIFKATRKHKYAQHMTQFLKELYDVFPEDLRNIIQDNWLVNPTGRSDGFRGVDWLVELNNLYTKVIYGGSGSNYTLKHVLEESILIELYCHCHVAIESGFYLVHRTIRHSPPDMKKTLEQLCKHYSRTQAHTFTKGRKSNCVMADRLWEGVGIYNEGRMDVDGSEESGENETQGIEPEDLI